MSVLFYNPDLVEELLVQPKRVCALCNPNFQVERRPSVQPTLAGTSVSQQQHELKNPLKNPN